jgi:hypothetical protein
MFYPGKPVMDVGSADFPNARSAMNSPLAKAIYGIDGKIELILFLGKRNAMIVYIFLTCTLYCFFTGINRVFFGPDFITITKSDDATWEFLKPEIFAAIMDFYSSGEPLFLDSQTAAAKDTAISEVYLYSLLIFQLSTKNEACFLGLCLHFILGGPWHVLMHLKFSLGINL